MDVLNQIAIFMTFISLFTFVIGFFMLFSDEKRKLGLKFLLFSVIIFIIGFSICVNNN